MDFNALIQCYIDDFHKRGEAALQTIANCTVPSMIVRIRYKKLPPIETLDEKEKNELWEYANEVYPNETNQFKIHFCQIVYTIGTLL